MGALQNYTPEEIRKLRKRLRLSQEELARKLGVSFTSVNRWENGQSKPSKLAMQQIEKFCIDLDAKSLVIE